jgi:hypothetical protein
MTFDDEQEMAILKYFVENPNAKVSAQNPPPEIANFVGAGAWTIMKGMCERGLLIEEGFEFPVRFQPTQAAVSKYVLLKKQKRAEGNLNQILIWTLIFAAVAAVASIIALFK